MHHGLRGMDAPGNTQSHRIYKLRGSPAWKHTFTQEEDTQALWEFSINTRGYTSSVGVQRGNIQSRWIYKLRGSPAWKHTGSVGENIHIGPDLVLTLGGGRSRG